MELLNVTPPLRRRLKKKMKDYNGDGMQMIRSDKHELYFEYNEPAFNLRLFSGDTTVFQHYIFSPKDERVLMIFS